jgi:hypothetical protein
VLSGRSLCEGLITRPEKRYRLWRVVACDQETLNTRRLKPDTELWKYNPMGCTPGKQTNNNPAVVFTSRMLNFSNTISRFALPPYLYTKTPKRPNRLWNAAGLLWVPCPPPPGGKQPGREVNPKFTSSTDVMNEWIHALLPLYAFIAFTGKTLLFLFLQQTLTNK